LKKMKKTVYLLLAVLSLTSCQRKETGHTVKKTESLIDPKNPLNQLLYENKIDFYCNMDITKYGVADTTRYKGKLYGFCAKMCKDEFLKNPEMYLAKSEK